AKYPDAEALAGANPADVETIIQSTGFYRAKTKSIVTLSQAIVEKYDGEVPGTLTHLVTLPAVVRKTAMLVLGNAVAVPGITVDTHCGRLVRRFGWTDASDPDTVEAVVGALFPKRDWTMLSHRVIWHGRRRCHARKPACGACPLDRICPAYGEGPTDPVAAEKLVRDGPRR